MMMCEIVAVWKVLAADIHVIVCEYTQLTGA